MTAPHDVDAERAAVAPGLRRARLHATNPLSTGWRSELCPTGDYYFPQHAQIHDALDSLADIDWPPPVDADWPALWPQTPPLVAHVRLAAVWTMCDHIDLAPLHRITEVASTRRIQSIDVVLQRAAERDELGALTHRLDELVGPTSRRRYFTETLGAA